MAKRLRACDACRRKKVSCSRERPSCDKCSKSNSSCVYPSGAKEVTKSKTLSQPATSPSPSSHSPSSSISASPGFRALGPHPATVATSSKSSTLANRNFKMSSSNHSQQAHKGSGVATEDPMDLSAGDQTASRNTDGQSNRVYSQQELDAAEGLLALWRSQDTFRPVALTPTASAQPPQQSALYHRAKAAKVGTSLTQAEAEFAIIFGAKVRGEKSPGTLTRSLGKELSSVAGLPLPCNFKAVYEIPPELEQSYHVFFTRFLEQPKYPRPAPLMDKTDMESGQEEAFHERPSIKLIVPDPLKALLVGDWENITRNNQLVPLPKAKPVRVILEDYLRLESAKRTEQAQVDVLEEIIQGLGVYFDQCLGRVLLYSFERCQYIELTEQRQADEGELAGLTERDIYGAEHLARLIVALPEMIVQTNMDQQSTNRLRDELKRFCIWLSIEAHNYFSANYETPNQAYIDKARTTQN